MVFRNRTLPGWNAVQVDRQKEKKKKRKAQDGKLFFNGLCISWRHPADPSKNPPVPHTHTHTHTHTTSVRARSDGDFFLRRRRSISRRLIKSGIRRAADSIESGRLAATRPVNAGLLPLLLPPLLLPTLRFHRASASA